MHRKLQVENLPLSICHGHSNSPTARRRGIYQYKTIDKERAMVSIEVIKVPRWRNSVLFMPRFGQVLNNAFFRQSFVYYLKWQEIIERIEIKLRLIFFYWFCLIRLLYSLMPRPGWCCIFFLVFWRDFNRAPFFKCLHNPNQSFGGKIVLFHEITENVPSLKVFLFALRKGKILGHST